MSETGTSSGSLFKRYAIFTVGTFVTYASGAMLGPLGLIAVLLALVMAALIVLLIPTVALRATPSRLEQIGLIALEVVNMVILGLAIIPFLARMHRP